MNPCELCSKTIVCELEEQNFVCNKFVPDRSKCIKNPNKTYALLGRYARQAQKVPDDNEEDYSS